MGSEVFVCNRLCAEFCRTVRGYDRYFFPLSSSH